MLVLKVEVGAMSQGKQGSVEAGTGKEVDSPHRASRKEQRPTDTLRLAREMDFGHLISRYCR